VTQGANVRTLTHDGAGNISADARVGTTYNYRYNKRGRLDQLSVGSTVTADYIYDGLERMALRTTQNMTPAGTTHYVYDLAGHLIAESTDSGATLREYLWLDDLPLAVVADVDTASPHLYFVHADHLDRPIKMTDGSKAVVWDAVYRPFGEAHSITGTASNNLRFPGQYFLIESGLHYNWHRHYDPTLGRYTQPDPLGFVDGSSLYAYVGSSPTSRVDATGEFWPQVTALVITGLIMQIQQAQYNEMYPPQIPPFPSPPEPGNVCTTANPYGNYQQEVRNYTPIPAPTAIPQQPAMPPRIPNTYPPNFPPVPR
jgi:RHS repeat-associated protein